MRIAFIITGLGMGGAERQLCDVVDELLLLGHSVLIICLTGEVVNQPRRDGAMLINLNMSKNPFGFLNAYYKVYKIIKAFSPDVVHSHMVHSNILARLIRLILPIEKLVCTAHNKNEGGFLRMLIYRLTDSLSDLNTNVSQEAVDEFVKKKAFSARKSCSIYNGIDTDLFKYNKLRREFRRNELNINEASHLLLSVGRLTEAKDYPNLLNAFAVLPLSPKPHLAIIGAGELEIQLKQEAIRLGIEERVHWLGITKDVAEWYSACDLFVLSSRWEGFGLVVAEAMSCERPIVVTDAGGVAEVVGNSKLVVPVNDSNALAEKIIEVLNYQEEEIKIILSNNRQRIINNFSIKKIAQQWLMIYNS
ncbi:glycosyltransferase [Hafnia paralvei]|uniref:glycosyltransferase n=1 Tax=Hafnia paralvei TaxID=546367 RepID=UPI00163C0121|nr:glycosyltransferase [Hafnia paralvei]